MKSIEVTGKTVEEAKQSAAEQLGVPEEEIEFEILEEPGKGFLGLSHSPARVKATVPGPEGETEEMPGPDETIAPRVEIIQTGRDQSVDEIANEIVALLEQIFSAMNVTAEASVKSVDEEEIAIDINGPDVAILIGKQGQTLDALQYLMGIAANRKHTNKVRLVLDAEGYRQRHADMLIAKAMDYVRHVKETGEEAVFDPMPARDRRTIHMALVDDPDVFTYSEGEGMDRHLVISPRKQGEEPKESEE